MLNKNHTKLSLIILQFGKNDKLKKLLFETAGTTLVEASPKDTIWGIGLESSHDDAKDRTKWRGKNLLGYALTDVRQHLMDLGPKKVQHPNPADYPTKYTFFWRSESKFSQWHPAEFEIDEIKYNCAEQYMMHQKACRSKWHFW